MPGHGQAHSCSHNNNVKRVSAPSLSTDVMIHPFMFCGILYIYYIYIYIIYIYILYI